MISRAYEALDAKKMYRKECFSNVHIVESEPVHSLESCWPYMHDFYTNYRSSAAGLNCLLFPCLSKRPESWMLSTTNKNDLFAIHVVNHCQKHVILTLSLICEKSLAGDFAAAFIDHPVLI